MQLLCLTARPIYNLLTLTALLWLTLPGCAALKASSGPWYGFDDNGNIYSGDEAGDLSSVMQLENDSVRFVRPMNSRLLYIQGRNQQGYLADLEKSEVRRLNGLPQSRIIDPADKSRKSRTLWDLKARYSGGQRDARHWLGVNDHDVVETADGGKTWQLFKPTIGPGNGKYELGKRNLYMSIEWFEDGKNEHIFVGTAYNGLYHSGNAGKTWRKTNNGLPHIMHSNRVAFFEGIRALAWDATTKKLYAGTEFGKGIYVATVNAGGPSAFKAVSMPDGFAEKRCSIYNLTVFQGRVSGDSDCGMITVSTDKDLTATIKPVAHQPASYETHVTGKKGDPEFKYSLVMHNNKGSWQGHYFPHNLKPLPSRYKAGSKGRNCTAIYISPTTTRKKLGKVESLLKSGLYNCVVVDVKDDSGRVPREIKTPLTEEYGTPRSNWRLEKLMKLLDSYKVWKIARLVTFKDGHLHSKAGGKYALKDRYTKKSWQGAGQEYWVNPYSRDVWEYMGQVAAQTVKAGFDEVQFDYIRFPSDGAIGRILIDDKDKPMYKSEALSSFLAHMRSKVSAPISIDIYGYHALYRIGTPIGQNMQLLGRYVDAISPMVYSSHFGDRYLSQGPVSMRAYNLLYHCTWRAIIFARGNFLIRNWLQAFKMKVGLWGWGDYYYSGQVQGTADGGGQGWLWWGPIDLFPYKLKPFTKK